MENSKELKIAIGYELLQLLNLKVDAAGKVKTSWGKKSVEGLGASVLSIVEQQKERLS
jgi:hypothetical protein